MWSFFVIFKSYHFAGRLRKECNYCLQKCYCGLLSIFEYLKQFITNVTERVSMMDFSQSLQKFIFGLIIIPIVILFFSCFWKLYDFLTLNLFDWLLFIMLIWFYKYILITWFPYHIMEPTNSNTTCTRFLRYWNVICLIVMRINLINSARNNCFLKLVLIFTNKSFFLEEKLWDTFKMLK